MTYETILFSLDAGVARLTFNRPDRLNAFTTRMHVEVAEALARVEAAGDARVLLLTGAGRGFCAGQDLNDRKAEPGAPPLDLGTSIETYYSPLITRLTTMRVPVVCAVNGVAAGAGANIALACDLVLAKTSARFIQSFANVGLMSDAGGAWILPRLIGQARAMGLVLTGEPIGAAQAADWGMIWRAIADETFDAEVEALVQRLATAPTLALTTVKQAMRRAGDLSLADYQPIERDGQRLLGRSRDYAEGVAAFLEKRPPQFRGD